MSDAKRTVSSMVSENSDMLWWLLPSMTPDAHSKHLEGPLC